MKPSTKPKATKKAKSKTSAQTKRATARDHRTKYGGEVGVYPTGGIMCFARRGMVREDLQRTQARCTREEKRLINAR